MKRRVRVAIALFCGTLAGAVVSVGIGLGTWASHGHEASVPFACLSSVMIAGNIAAQEMYFCALRDAA